MKYLFIVILLTLPYAIGAVWHKIEDMNGPSDPYMEDTQEPEDDLNMDPELCSPWPGYPSIKPGC